MAHSNYVRVTADCRSLYRQRAGGQAYRYNSRAIAHQRPTADKHAYYYEYTIQYADYYPHGHGNTHTARSNCCRRGSYFRHARQHTRPILYRVQSRHTGRFVGGGPQGQSMHRFLLRCAARPHGDTCPRQQCRDTPFQFAQHEQRYVRRELGSLECGLCHTIWGTNTQRGCKRVRADSDTGCAYAAKHEP